MRHVLPYQGGWKYVFLCRCVGVFLVLCSTAVLLAKVFLPAAN
jgi:hypothetical protein